MLRYMIVPTISFTDYAGVTRPIKDLRLIPSYTPYITVRRRPSEPLDAVACRDDVYGPGNEGNAYVLHEANMAFILDRQFDYSGLLRVQVPIP